MVVGRGFRYAETRKKPRIPCVLSRCLGIQFLGFARRFRMAAASLQLDFRAIWKEVASFCEKSRQS